MNNFRRRSSAKKQRTVVSTSYVVDSFGITDINITNGTFRINKSTGSTADLSITITYTATTYLKTVYSDGTVEQSNTTTSSGTCTFTKATLIEWSFYGLGIDIKSKITLSNIGEKDIVLYNIPYSTNNGLPLRPPVSSGGEVRYNCVFDFADKTEISDILVYDAYVYIANTGVDTYYVNIYK